MPTNLVHDLGRRFCQNRLARIIRLEEMAVYICFEENGEVTRYDLSGFDAEGTDIKGESNGEGC
jgi:hypothetical protein